VAETFSLYLPRKPLESETLRSVGYDRGRLQAEFTSGALYEYSEVPEREHDALMRAESPGRYFHRHIRGRYRHRRLREPD
jgi:hypothetical protein